MKLKIFSIVIAFFAIGLAWFYMKSQRNSAMPLSYVPENRFDRGGLISKVSKGDKDAAFELGQHYANNGIPEAAYYWFGVAFRLGNENVNQSFLEYYEHTIIGEFDSGPYKESIPKER
jgi:hypothetical protein